MSFLEPIIALLIITYFRQVKNIALFLMYIGTIVFLVHGFSELDLIIQLIFGTIFILVILFIRWWVVNEDRIDEEIKQNRAKRRAEYKRKKALEEKINDFQI